MTFIYFVKCSVGMKSLNEYRDLMSPELYVVSQKKTRKIVGLIKPLILQEIMK